jgi:GTPase
MSGKPGQAPGDLTRPDFRCGYIAIAGKPNTGKSTLLNRILGQKIAIVADKPNTTRNRILGVKTLPSAQLIFMDTPGIHDPKKALNKFMVDQALAAAAEADLIYLMVQADQPWLEPDLLTLEKLKALGLPMVLVINKIDLVEKSALLPIIDQSSKLAAFKEIVPISALLGDGIEQLVKAAMPFLPEGVALFPEDMATDQAEKFWAAELVREKIINLTHQEIPYAAAVRVEEWKESKGLIAIHAVIFVERDSQKGIIIGKAGQMIKKIGQQSREEIEQVLGCKVFLELRVKVEKDWSKTLLGLKRMGYQ